MNITDAVINAGAVWAVLKAVEVVPFALYDVFIWSKKAFRGTKVDSSDYPKLTHRYDKCRGKLEFVFSGAGFLRFSACQKRKKVFLTASLVPVLVFVVEIFSIFLSNETYVCHTSKDPNVVTAPALQLFGEGEQEIDAVELNNEILHAGRMPRPCLRRHSTYSGVEYIASLCSDPSAAISNAITARSLFPDNDRIAILVEKPFEQRNELYLHIASKKSGISQNNFKLIGSIFIFSDVSVNGKVTLISDIIKETVINETVIQQIHSDFRVLEKRTNLTRSNFMEYSEFFMFEWDDPDPSEFLVGAINLIVAIMAQSRRVELKTAAEMSSRNMIRDFIEVDISCEEDFFLPRKVSIIIIITAALLRLLLLAVPTSISSVQYALLVSQEGEGHASSAEFAKEQPRIAAV